MQQTTTSLTNSEKINEALKIIGKKESVFDKIMAGKELGAKPSSVIADLEPAKAKLWTDELNLEMSNQDIELDLDEIDKVIHLKSQAIQLYRKKNFLEALRKLEDAIRVIPGDLDLLFYEAMCLFRLGNVERALNIFEKLVELDRTHSLPLLPKMFSMSLLKLERYQEAERFLKKTLSKHSYDSQLQNMAAYALERQGKLTEAEEIYLKILEDHKDDCNAANGLAYVYFKQNKFLDKALNLVKKALDKEPENPSFLDTFGMILYQKGNVDAARKALKKALEGAPKNSEILSHINQLFNL